MATKKSKTKVIALSALVTSTTAVGVYANREYVKNNSEENVETAKLLVDKIDKDTVKVSIENVNNSAKAFQLSLKIDGNVKFEEKINWLTSVETNEIPKKENLIESNYILSEDKKSIDIFVASNEELDKNGSIIEVCEIDLNKSGIKSNSDYKIIPNDIKPYKSVDVNNKSIEVANMDYDKDNVLKFNTPPTIELKKPNKSKSGYPKVDITNKIITIKEGFEFKAKAYVTVNDAEDGNIDLDKVNVKNSNGSNLPDTANNLKVGTYDLIYSVVDSENEAGSLDATLIVEPNTWKELPTIVGVPKGPIKLKVGDVFDVYAPNGETVTAKDTVGNNLEVIVSGELDLNTVGTYTITYIAKDRFDNTRIQQLVIQVGSEEVQPPTEETTVTKLIGSDRYETAAKISKEGYNSANTVIIVNGDSKHLVDGLTATPLASIKNAPILLSNNKALPKHTSDEIKRLKPSNVIVIGGEGATPNSIIDAIKDIDSKIKVQRIGGIDRFETSLNIAKEIDKTNSITKIYVGAGYGEADSLSISSVAGRDKSPIILTEKEGLTKATYDYIKSQKVSDGYIIGGDSVISDGAIKQIDSIISKDISKNRIAGINRQETNAKVIDKFYSDTKLNGVVVAKDDELVDALSVGPLAAKKDMPIVLATENIDKSQEVVLNKKKSLKVYETGGGIKASVINKIKSLVNNRK